MVSVRKKSKRNFQKDAKRAAIELGRAKVPISDIRKQLKMSESTLRRILAFAKAHPEDPSMPRKPVAGRPKKVSIETRRLIKTKLDMTKYYSSVDIRHFFLYF